MENAPDGNGKEQTVRSLIFAPMLHVMSETNANDCHTCVVCANDVFDKNLFCSTCAGISFEGFDNFDNSDVLKHKPVLTMFWMTVENFQVWRSFGNFVQDWLGVCRVLKMQLSHWFLLRVPGFRFSNLQFPPFWTFLQLIRAPCLNVCQFGHRLLLHFCLR